MKKTLLILSALAIFSLAPHTLAQGFVPLTNIPGLTDSATTNAVLGPQGGFAAFLNNLYKYLIGIAAVLAVIEIIWGGIELSNQDSVSMHSEGVERIQQAVLGLVLVLSPVLVFTIINPSILNLSLNLPPINLVSGGTTGATSQATPCTSNCNTGVSGASAGITAGANVGLIACAGSDCSAAMTACTSKSGSVPGGGGSFLQYSGTVVCTSSPSAIDPNGATATNGNNATACKTGEALAVNCSSQQVTGVSY